MINNDCVKQLAQLVNEVLKFDYPTDKLLSNFFRNNRKIESNERYIIAETIYGILRNYYKLKNALGETKNSLKLIAIAWLKFLKLDEKLYAKVSLLNFAEATHIEFKNDIESKFKKITNASILKWICFKWNSTTLRVLNLAIFVDKIYRITTAS